MLRDSYWDSPFELFLFQTGASTFYAYTTSEKPVVHLGRTYNPIAISRDNITSSGSLDKTRIKVIVPLVTEIAELFRLYPPGFKVSLKIFSGSLNAVQSGISVIWVGRVIQSSREPAGNDNGEQCVLSCEPASTTMRQSGLRANWQLPCRHVLYAPRCGASEAAATVLTTAGTVGANWIDVPPGWEGARPRGKYVSGKVTWDGPLGREQRRILAVTESRITISGTTQHLVLGDEIGVVLGCNRQMEDCINLHNRIHSFGGFPFIPTENPINKSQV